MENTQLRLRSSATLLKRRTSTPRVTDAHRAGHQIHRLVIAHPEPCTNTWPWPAASTSASKRLQRAAPSPSPHRQSHRIAGRRARNLKSYQDSSITSGWLRRRDRVPYMQIGKTPSSTSQHPPTNPTEGAPGREYGNTRAATSLRGEPPAEIRVGITPDIVQQRHQRLFDPARATSGCRAQCRASSNSNDTTSTRNSPGAIITWERGRQRTTWHNQGAEARHAPRACNRLPVPAFLSIRPHSPHQGLSISRLRLWYMPMMECARNSCFTWFVRFDRQAYMAARPDRPRRSSF